MDTSETVAKGIERHGDGRLASNPSLDLHAARPIRFRFDGHWVNAYEGDTIASALHAAGVRTLNRSFKYHRPRGLLCVAGRCANCLCNVDGVPHMRSCVTPVSDGMEVRPQKGWPSPDTDVFGIIDKLSPLLPVGFYYKTFIHPRPLWPVYEKVLRHMAGYGDLDHERPPQPKYKKEYYHADVAVIGGGPAGLRAARAATRAGAHVALIDDQPALGGHLRFQVRSHGDSPFASQQGPKIALSLAEELTSEGNVEVFLGATAFGIYEDNLIGVLQGERLIKLRAERIVVATGRQEYLLPFGNNDLPGVMLGTGAQRLMHLYGVRPGEQALVVSANDHGLGIADDLLAAGVGVVGVVDLRPQVDSDSETVMRLHSAGVPLLTGHTVVEATGKKQVTGAVVAQLDAAAEVVPGTHRRFSCDLICVSTGFQTASSLLYQAGCKLRYDEEGAEFVPDTLVNTVFAAGDVTGVHDLESILLEGELAGLRAAHSLGPDGSSSDLVFIDELRSQFDRLRERASGYRPARFLASAPDGDSKKFVCLCEDVTEKEIASAIHEGFEGVEYLKRYTTYSMGPCQGKMCNMSAIGICARETGLSIPEVGTTTARPPVQPVPLGALAGRLLTPTKLTPMHEHHKVLDAELMDTGVWRRPRQYGQDAMSEARTVREGLGLIDVSTLGKLEVSGPSATELLEKVFVNKVADLKIGRSRYWVLCDDAGIILDEGTVSRLGTERFFVTTSSAGVTTTGEWLSWWMAGTDMCAHVTDITDGLASVNLAGPHSREALAPLTDVDLSTGAFPYLGVRRGHVAGVPALLLRIGFVGELGYEVHVPAEYGGFLWETLTEAGRAFGIRPFGVEAQRILRLEKRHLIAAVDTDALSTALEADLAWAVKFDKPDFIGKSSLERVKERGLRQKLVGYRMDDPRLVPEDGSSVLVNGELAGRVTSARYSASLGQSIGMAWVPAGRSAPGQSFDIRLNGGLAQAHVVAGPFYDPDGKRMKV